MNDSSDEDAAEAPRQTKRSTGGVGRACDFCHRMKMKCVGKDSPPCNRCRDSGHECTFDVPRKAKAVKLENRVRDVEGQMDSMQASLQELLRLQRAQMASQNSNAAAYQPVALSYPHRLSNDLYASPGTSLSLGNLMGDPSGSQSQLFNPNLQPDLQRSNPNYPAIPIDTPDTAANLFGSRLSAPETYSQPPSAQTPWSISGHSRIRSPGSDDEELDPNDPLVPARVLAPWDNMVQLAEAARLQADRKASEEDHLPTPASTDATTARKRRRGEGADPQDDITDTDAAPGFAVSNTKKASPNNQLDALEVKSELADTVTSTEGRVDHGRISFSKGSHTRHILNPVELGYCTEEKGKQLFDIFLDRCSIYVPVFEPGVDTWDSLRKRSPFTITAIIMVGAKVQDGSQPPSELQTKCREHAEKIAMSTLFTPVAGIEDLQAMIVLSAWGDTSWRPGGHALRMGMEMGLFRCLSSLYLRGSSVGKTEAQLLEEKPLVVGARVWLALFKQEHEMAYNLGRPALSMDLTHARSLLEHPYSIETDSRLVATCELLATRYPVHQDFCISPSANVPGLDEKIRRVNQEGDVWQTYWSSFYDNKGVPETHFLRESLTTQRAHFTLSTNARILTGIRSKRDVGLLSEERRNALLKAIRAAATIVTMALRSQNYTRNFRFANHYTHVGVAFAAMFLIRLASLLPEAVNLRQTGRDVEQVAKMLSEVPGFQYAHLLRDVIGKARRKHHLPPASKPASPKNRPNPLSTIDPPSDASTTHTYAWDRGLTSSWGTGVDGQAGQASVPSSIDFSINGTSASGSVDADFSHGDFILVDQLFNSGMGNGGLGTALLGGLGGDAGLSVGRSFNFSPGGGGGGVDLAASGSVYTGLEGLTGSTPSGLNGLQDFNFPNTLATENRNFNESTFNDVDAWFPFPPLDQDRNAFIDNVMFR